jgi:hypothetical protein
MPGTYRESFSRAEDEEMDAEAIYEVVEKNWSGYKQTKVLRGSST